MYFFSVRLLLLFLISISYIQPLIKYILFVCPQLDNPDEQAAQIRRELDGRLQMADQIARVRP